ncbi:enoyl-CoA hydratase [Variovorax sp. PCZ-1]|uniref:enoyl-CoA hydratase n=1 Tax=Variovorax sp. PCZ-1 TaxID=2835533 RepID=UPI001BCE46AC|nr:enoyl-CoA hydratase [Variovorax sp. PCZ-1]MBS7807369.1 enoyl-CoA hydratase [Variovorax sp. PCZ-1]
MKPTLETASTDLVIRQRDARGVITLTLNQPENYNALSTHMIAALQQALDAVAKDDGARAVVLAAQGKAFCPGHNLKDMAAHADEAYYQQLFKQCSKMMLSIAKLPVPVIARVHGIATAAGCQLAAQCDLAVCSPLARFATSGIHYGLFCSTPSVPLTRTILHKHAMQMLITGEFVDASTALQFGLVNAVATDESESALDAEVEKLVSQIVNKPRLALQMGKELVLRQQGLNLEAAYALAGQTMAANMMDASAKEGVQAFVEKRIPGWKTV